MKKTKHYYKPIGVAVVACLIIAAPFMIFTLERHPASPVAQESTIQDELHRAYMNGWNDHANTDPVPVITLDEFQSLMEECK